MKELTVSLDLCTQTLTLSELCKQLGCSPSPGSHSKGDPRPSPDDQTRVWTQTIWRLDSDLSKDAPLKDHLESLVAHFPPSVLSRPRILPEDAKVWITVGVFFDTVTVSLAVSPEELDIVKAYGASFEVTCYPCQPISAP